MPARSSPSIFESNLWRRVWPAYWMACSVVLLTGTGCKHEPRAEMTARVVIADLVQEVQVTGELKATDSLAVAPPPMHRMWEYKIAYLAEEGARVEKGTPLVGFETRRLDEILQRVEAELTRTKHELDRRQSDFALARENDQLNQMETQARQRKNELKAQRPADLLASLEMDKAKLDHQLSQQEVVFAKSRSEGARKREAAEVLILKNRIQRMQEEVQEIKEDIERLTVKSSRAGVVIHRGDRHGDKRKVGDTVWRGAVLLEVVTLHEMYALGQIDEVDISKVAVGKTVSLRLEAYPDTEHGGKLRRIDDTVSRDGQKKVLRLEIALGKTDPVTMRPGMRFRGRIETGRVTRALQIPLDAVLAGVKGAKVVKQQKGNSVDVAVKLGARNDTHVQVLSGLHEGDLVTRFVSTGEP